MKKWSIRTVLGAAIAVAALTLAGCAADPDVSGLESELSTVSGVNGSIVYTTHSGAPWNTQVQVLLFLDEPSDTAIVDAVRDAAPIIVADPAATGNEVTFAFIDGQRDAYADRFEAFRDDVGVSAEVRTELALPDGGSRRLTVSPQQMRALAEDE